MHKPTGPGAATALAALTEEFWAWRVSAQPSSYDDVARVERPVGWTADWSINTVAANRQRRDAFAARLDALDLASASIAVDVDARLLRCALDRVTWELDVLRRWQRDPRFYCDQALVPFFELLLRPGPFDDIRARAVLANLENIPTVLDHGRANLAATGVSEFARNTVDLLTGVETRLPHALAGTAPLLPPSHRDRLKRAGIAAVDALVAYRTWTAEQDFTGDVHIGARALGFFLHKVALLPYTPSQMRLIAGQEAHRFAAIEAIEAAARPGPTQDHPDPESYIQREAVLEVQVRAFYHERGLLILPAGLRPYVFALMPDHLDPLTWIGQPHYVGSPQRPEEPAIRYVRRAVDGMPYFQLAKVSDPRTGIAHEGVHAHQIAWSWTHADPARRRYYDSCANEGIACYNEELLLAAGLFADEPSSAEFIANGGRLRALRVEADIALALGDMTIDEATGLLETIVDPATAREEAASFAINPGQGLSYLIGKFQIIDMLASYLAQHGKDSLAWFNQRLWLEGNVPLALQRWELLGDHGHLDTADRLAAI